MTSPAPDLPVVAWQLFDVVAGSAFVSDYAKQNANYPKYTIALCDHTAATSALTAALARAESAERERDGMNELCRDNEELRAELERLCSFVRSLVVPPRPADGEQ